jgi:hypothetical protein
MSVRVEAQLPEDRHIAQRLEHLAVQLAREIHDAFETIAESKPDAVLRLMSSAYESHHGLLQGGDWLQRQLQRLALPTQRPVGSEFISMQIIPLQEDAKSAPREAAGDHAALDRHLHLELAVVGVEMRRRVVSVLHRHHDSEEATDFRHG